MGMRGPIPARDQELARPRSRNGRGDVTTKGQMRPVQWPDAPSTWHQIAVDLYDAVKNSGQSDFYQQSDIALLYSLCEDLSVYKNSTKRSGQMLQTIYGSLASLLVTEGDRRRVHIELHAPEVEKPDAAVLAIASYKKDLETD